MHKFNSDSWKKSASDLRDHRSIKVSDETKKLPAKKDTKRWCKGKEGTEHQLQVFNGKISSLKTKQLGCKVCGKIFETHWGFLSWDKRNPPFWIKDELLAKCIVQCLIKMFGWVSKDRAKNT